MSEVHKKKSRKADIDRSLLSLHCVSLRTLPASRNAFRSLQIMDSYMVECFLFFFFKFSLQFLICSYG